MSVNHAVPEYQSVDLSPGHAAGKANVLPAFGAATLLYAVFCLFFLLFSTVMDGDPIVIILHVGAGFALLLFWRQMRWGAGRYDSFGAAMLLIGAIFRFQAALDAGFYGARLDEIPSTVPLPDNIALLLLKSEALSLFGTLVLVAVWRAAVGRHIGEFSFLQNYRQVGRRLPGFMYVGAIVVEMLKRIAGADFGVLLQISALTYLFGVVSIFFIAAVQKSPLSRVVIAVCLALPMMGLAMGGGMKSEIFLPAIPAALLFWFGFRSNQLRILVVAAAFVLLAYSQLYVEYVRRATWATGAQVATSDLLQGFQEGLIDTDLKEGMNSISSRMNMTTSRAITVAIADARGFEPGNIFGPIPASIIPRFLWASKPVLQPGAQHTFRVQDIDALPSEATTATATGFFSELYLGGSYVGWLVGVAVYGYMLARIQLATLAKLPGFGHLTLSFVTAIWALRFEEIHIAYAYTSLIFTALFLLILLKTAVVFRIKSKQ